MEIVVAVIVILLVFAKINSFLNRQLAKDQKQLQNDFVDKMDSFTEAINKLTEKVGRK